MSLTLGLNIALLIAVGKTCAAPNNAVFLVQARDCVGRPSARNLTGFYLRDSSFTLPSGSPAVGIFTALHGVAGCKDIRMQADSGPLLAKAVTIIGIDFEHDVACLSSDEFVSKYHDGLTARRHLVSASTSLRVIGYPLNISDQSLDSSVRFRHPPKRKLSTLLSPDLQRSLAGRGSPNPSVDVFSIEGHILPGHSGAPILDEGDQVVGIADGGLREGFAEISWAIPILEVTMSPVERNGQLLTALATFDSGALFDIGAADVEVSKLEKAVYADNSAEVVSALQAGHFARADVDAAVMIAVALNHPEALEALGTEGHANPNYRVQDTTPICEAVRLVKIEALRVLARLKDIDPNVWCTFSSGFRWTPLQWTVFTHTIDVLEVLVTIPAIDGNVPGINRLNLLWDVVQDGNTTAQTALRLLLRMKNMNLNTIQYTVTVADWAAMYKPELLGMLLDAGAKGHRFSTKQMRAILKMRE